MPVIRSAVRSVLSDAIREVISSLAIQRYFSTFDPVLNTYGELDTAFAPAGDFEVEVDVTLSLNRFICSGDSNSTWIGVTSIGTLTVRVAGSSITYTGPTLTEDGLLHTIKVERIGNQGTLYVDGIQVGQNTVSTGNFVIEFVGAESGLGSQFWNGIIANVKLTDLATSSNSRIFPVGLSGGASVENSTINSGSITYYNLPAANQERFTRYIRPLIEFDPVLNSYCELATAFTPSGDFEIEVLVMPVSVGWYAIFSSTAPAEIFRLMVTSGGALAFDFDVSSRIATADGVIQINKINLIKVSRVGEILTLSVNGNTEASGSYAGSFSLYNTGKNSTTRGNPDYFDGIIANVKLTDLVTPANSRVFKLNALTGSTENSIINTGSITYNNIPEGNRNIEDFWLTENGDGIIEA